MTQTEWVLSRLKRKKKLTAMDALNGCGCFRLAARINDLRRQGHNITTESVSTGGKVYARYRLAKTKGK